MPQLDVLVTGGSGYLGQHLLHALSNSPLISRLFYTYLNAPLPSHALPDVEGFPVDFASEDGGKEASRNAIVGSKGRKLVVINTAAISTPATCESDSMRTERINVPNALMDVLLDLFPEEDEIPYFVQLSTDQIYPGTCANSTEDAERGPVNAYARSKLAAEETLERRWPAEKQVSLRSSIICGPDPPFRSVGRPMFLQFCEAVLRQGKPTTFFHDEFRNPVFVGDIVAVIHSILRGLAGLPSTPTEPSAKLPLPMQKYNMGGPSRFSRVEMAHLVARYRGISLGDAEKVILSVPSDSVKRPYASPKDISMDSSALTKDFGVVMRELGDVMREILGAADGSGP